jgi:GNAT superfamily N-acetyltransferase
MHELVFRPALVSDVAFLTRAICAAERLPLAEPCTMYERMFGMTPVELDAFLTEALVSDGVGHQLTVRSFNVLEASGKPIACCAAWIESASGQPSGLKTSVLVSRFLGATRWRACASAIRAVGRNAPRRTALSLQLETFFVEPAHRGRGLTRQLIEESVVSVLRESSPGAAEIVLLRENVHARAVYEHCGFSLAWQTDVRDAEFEALTGSTGYLLLRRALPSSALGEAT